MPTTRKINYKTNLAQSIEKKKKPKTLSKSSEKKQKSNKSIVRKKIKSNSLANSGIDKTIKCIVDVVPLDNVEIDDAVIEFEDGFCRDEESQLIFISSSSEDLIEDLHKKERRNSKTIFDVEDIDDPLVGTPTEVRKELDALALKLQKNPTNQAIFIKIVSYMHKYILGLVFKKYSFVKGYDEKDIYQEALIALFKKAVPSFRKGKGMSFLNFAKMCINRHLITILNASINRRKDMPLNTSISLDHSPSGREEDGDESCPLSNVIPDKIHGKPPFTEMSRYESFSRTIETINSVLSDFEKEVLVEYLKDKSYREAAKSMSKIYGKKCNERSIDNALLRIRKKAMALKSEFGEDLLPLVFGNVES